MARQVDMDVKELEGWAASAPLVRDSSVLRTVRALDAVEHALAALLECLHHLFTFE
jgi:hypothetical protein